MAVSAAVILDSVSPTGQRLTTFEVTLHRFVLAEMNTHRVFSRNSASSRAIPIDKQIARVLNDVAMPVEFGTNQPGMQAGPPLVGRELRDAGDVWLDARDSAVQHARELLSLNVHKQVVNRLLEPFMWHTMVISGTSFSGFFEQRSSNYSVQAQPEIQLAADLMLAALNASEPTLLAHGEWHLPYVKEEESDLDIQIRKELSGARSARVSYLTHDGQRDLNKDVELFSRLKEASPRHWSPLEHQATPCPANRQMVGELKLPKIGNFVGWLQQRHEDRWEDLN